jgi:hypothetical protein
MTHITCVEKSNRRFYTGKGSPTNWQLIVLYEVVYVLNFSVNTLNTQKNCLFVAKKTKASKYTQG